MTQPPRPQAGQVMVNVDAAGVNYIDVYQREGSGRYKTTLPFYPGLEGVGRIHEIGVGTSTNLSVEHRKRRSRWT